jgi:hypothetical protein
MNTDPSSSSSSSSSSSRQTNVNEEYELQQLAAMSESALLKLLKTEERYIRNIKKALEIVKSKRDIAERVTELKERGWTWSVIPLQEHDPIFKSAHLFGFEVYGKFSCSLSDAHLPSKSKWRFLYLEDQEDENDWVDYLGLNSEMENSDDVCRNDDWNMVDQSFNVDDNEDVRLTYETFGHLTIYLYQMPLKMPINQRFKIFQPVNGRAYDAMFDGRHLIMSRKNKGHVKIDHDDNSLTKQIYFIHLLDD